MKNDATLFRYRLDLNMEPQSFSSKDNKSRLTWLTGKYYFLSSSGRWARSLLVSLRYYLYDVTKLFALLHVVLSTLFVSEAPELLCRLFTSCSFEHLIC